MNNKIIHYRLVINLYDILIFVIFWSYGLCAGGSHPGFGLLVNSLLTIYIGSLVLLFGKYRDETNFTFNIIIKNLEILCLFFLGFVIVIMQLDHLKSDLVWDQLAHYRSTNIIGIKALPYLNKVLNLDQSAQTILYIINILVLVYCFFTFYLYFKISNNFKIYYILFSILTLRLFAFYLTGGNGEPYPPFRTFPIAMGSLFFGGGSFSARLSSLLIFLTCLITLYLVIRKHFSFTVSTLFIIILISINLILQVSSMVEQSIWTLAVLTPFLIRMATEKTILYKEHLFWIFLFSIVSLIRTPIFIIIPIYIIFLIFSTHYSLNKKIILLLPTLITFPYYLQMLIFGSNAFYQKGSIPIIPFEEIPIMRLKYALTEGIALHIWLSFLPILIISTYLIGPIIFFSIRKKIFILFVAIQALMLYQFFSIRLDHWGIGRYLIEYIVPFSLLTIFMITLKIFKYKVIIANLALIVIISTNIFLFNNNFFLIKEKDIKLEKEQFYDITDSIKWAVSKFDPSRIVILSVTYGETPFINSGLSWPTINKLVARKNEFIGSSEFINPGFDTINKLTNSKDVDVILLGDCPWDKEALFSFLIQNGWRKVGVFRNKMSGNEVIALEKDNSPIATSLPQ